MTDDPVTDQTARILTCYSRFRATSRFPDDPLVSWCAGLIRDEEDAFAREQAVAQTDALRGLGELLALTIRRRP